jgi:hypothetical protein
VADDFVEEGTMPRYQFSVGREGVVREAGAVLSESFHDALTAIAERSSVTHGETLEIGVEGVPPARYEFVMATLGTTGEWAPASRRLAA